MPTPTRALTLPRYTDAMARDMSEATLQGNIISAAETLGFLVYHTHDSRRSQPGFPDLACALDGRLILAELKTERGKLTPPQIAWGRRLSTAPGVEYYLWRPSDWLAGDVTRILAARPT